MRSATLLRKQRGLLHATLPPAYLKSEERIFGTNVPTKRQTYADDAPGVHRIVRILLDNFPECRVVTAGTKVLV